jgi:aspartyl aminopeptidase
MSLSSLPSTLLIDETDNDRADRCISFINNSPEPFNCVNHISSLLIKCGFVKLDEGTAWQIKRGGKYYFTRNGSSIVAFAVGGKYILGNGFKILGAHTDSPNIKLKPKTKRASNGQIQLNVECYGGGLWHTWFDRDLSIAGRVILKSSSTDNNESNNNEKFVVKTIKIDRPVLRIPNLCIHLRTNEEREAFKVNKEDHLIPILCDEIKTQMSTSATITTKEAGDPNEKKEVEEEVEEGWKSWQAPELLQLLATELSCHVEDIIDFELSLFDTQCFYFFIY